MKKIFFLLTIILASLHTGSAQTTEMKPMGVYKEIDVDRQNKTIEAYVFLAAISY